MQLVASVASPFDYEMDSSTVLVLGKDDEQADEIEESSTTKAST